MAILAAAAPLLAQSPAASGCLPDEEVFFSCRLEGNNKTVSLCASPKAAPFTAITYRYGSDTRNELTYVANADNNKHFLATVSTIDPKATVRQVWFEQSNTRYIVTACVGGNCPHKGGLIVSQGKRMLTSRACVRGDTGHPWFATAVVHFSSDVEGSHSNTDLIQLGDYDNGVDVLYPFKPVN